MILPVGLALAPQSSMTVHFCTPRGHTSWKETCASGPAGVWTIAIDMAMLRLACPPTLNPRARKHGCFFPITLGKNENRCGAEAGATTMNFAFDGLLESRSREL